MLLAEPLVVSVCVLNCNKVWVSVTLGGATDRPPFPSMLHLGQELLSIQAFNVEYDCRFSPPVQPPPAPCFSLAADEFLSSSISLSGQFPQRMPALEYGNISALLFWNVVLQVLNIV